jgi:hypothetical protein
MFASQFSVGFAVRVLDVVLLHGVDVIAKFALVIILDHKKELMQCSGLEQVMECFKTVVTNITSEKLDRYLRKVLESDWDKQMLTYAVEYSVMNDEAFHAFLSDSGSSGPSSSGGPSNRSKLHDRSSQTDPCKAESPPAEKHPILGDLIQRQNGEISKLKMEKADLRKDIQALLSCMVTMQKLAQISSGGRLTLPVPPEVSGIASKYFVKGSTSYASLLETSWTQKSSPGGTLPTDANIFSGNGALLGKVDGSISSSHSLPALDADSSGSDDSSDAGSRSPRHHPLLSQIDSRSATPITTTANRSQPNATSKLNLICDL